jgi:hypothetical protein
MPGYRSHKQGRLPVPQFFEKSDIKKGLFMTGGECPGSLAVLPVASGGPLPKRQARSTPDFAAIAAKLEAARKRLAEIAEDVRASRK